MHSIQRPGFAWERFFIILYQSALLAMGGFWAKGILALFGIGSWRYSFDFTVLTIPIF